MDGDGTSSGDDAQSCDRGEPALHGQALEGIPALSTADLTTTAPLDDGQESYHCDDKLKQQLDTLVIGGNNVDARLQEVETKLASAEIKLRSCNDILALIGLLKDRIRLVDEDEVLPGNAETSSSTAGQGYPPRSPMRSAKSPVRSPKSPRSHLV